MSTAILGLPNTAADGDYLPAATVNLLADTLEWVGAGYRSYDAAGSGSSLLAGSDYKSSVLAITGILTGARTLVLPLSAGRRWLVWNNTSGAYSLTLQGATGTGVTVAQGYVREVWTDGTNVYGGPERSAATDNVLRLASLLLLAGTGSQTVKAGGTLKTDMTAVGNVTTGEDDLISYTVPASVLGTDGDHLQIEAWGEFAANGNNKQLKLKFGGTTVYDSTAVAANGGRWRLTATIVRTGATAQVASAQLVTSNTTLTDEAAYATPAETLSGAIVLKMTGEGTATNDIVQRGLIVRYFPGQ